MDIKFPTLKILLMTAVVFALFLTSFAWSQPTKTPERGILVTLSVYSGRPNPQWWITDAKQIKKLSEIIKGLTASPEKSFDYDRWNRLGYANFWLNNKGLDGLPKAVQVWRNQAIVYPDQKEARPLYAKDALSLYSILVNQAEEKDQKQFFLKFQEWKKSQTPR